MANRRILAGLLWLDRFLTTGTLREPAGIAVDIILDDDVDRHGLGKLGAALRGAGLHYAGKMTQRMVASEIDIPDTESMMIVYALVPTLAVGRDYDPYFEYLFPDVHDQLELLDLDAHETSPTQPNTDE